MNVERDSNWRAGAKSAIKPGQALKRALLDLVFKAPDASKSVGGLEDRIQAAIVGWGDFEILAAGSAPRTYEDGRADMAHALGMDEPYSVLRVLTILADAADHLLKAHDCDTHGWEVFGGARDAARKIVARVEARSLARARSAVSP